MALNQDFGKERGQKLIVKKYKRLTSRRFEQATALKRITAGGYGGLEAKPPAAGVIFGKILGKKLFGKKSYFNLTGSHFARVHSHFKKLDFWHLKAKRKNLIVQSSFYMQLKSKTRLKSFIMA